MVRTFLARPNAPPTPLPNILVAHHDPFRRPPVPLAPSLTACPNRPILSSIRPPALRTLPILPVRPALRRFLRDFLSPSEPPPKRSPIESIMPPEPPPSPPSPPRPNLPRRPASIPPLPNRPPVSSNLPLILSLACAATSFRRDQMSCIEPLRTFSCVTSLRVSY
ncbi:IgA FC receptor precursor [compost metagenome]